MHKVLTTAALLALSLCLSAQSEAPAAVAPLPSQAQVEWQKMETYAFIHFGPNTFLNKEWGYGDAPLECFNPSKLDCEQWARTLKDAGMKAIIITAKHHDGFCLWPTMYTDYSVRNTPYKDGKGDIVGELASACKKYGLKFGVYLSPWDRHQAFYGTPLYVEYYHTQLRELLTKYGEIAEVWLDGANGGDGYYGGAREKRTIDRRTYYDFPRINALVSELQPNAVIFSDGGPGCRWVGNENGMASPTNWSFLRINEVYPGYPNRDDLFIGQKDGDTWIPSECDVSIRPGWFWHEAENDKVKSVDQLVNIYYNSVGHNGTMLLNVPVDTDGLIHPIDSARVIAFHKRISSELKTNLMQGQTTVKVSSVRSKAFGAKALTDGNYNTYWCAEDGDKLPSLTVTFKRPTAINRLMLQEYIPLGQRIESFKIEYQNGKEWLPLRLNEETTTIGYKRLLRFKPITAKRVRVSFPESRGTVCINEIGAFYAPNANDHFVESVDDVESLPFTINGTTADAITFDLGKQQRVASFNYLPDQSKEHKGLAANYELYVGDDEAGLRLVSKGEFSNIENNPIMQEVHFTPTRGRYVRLKATRMVKENEPLQYEKIAIR